MIGYQKRKVHTPLLISLCTALLLSGCGITLPDPYEKAPSAAAFTVRDKASLYAEQNWESVLYLCVGNGRDAVAHTWAQLNAHSLSWYAERGEEPFTCDALVQFGNEEGATPGSFGYDSFSPNATIRLSGANASTRQQKSYRVDINPGSGSLSGMKSFVLAKSFTDPFRFTNKLCFDLLTEVDGVPSTRTGFVHLYVKDRSEGPDALYVDCGLYTMIEPVNKRYLSNRDLDKSGELYQAVNFDFARHADVLVQPTSPAYDRAKFETLLQAKGSDDYTSLFTLLDAVNDGSVAIEDIVARYFDPDNLYGWMAFNILTGNQDTGTENFYLYSPTGTERFTIIPWDLDGTFRADYERLRDADYSPGWRKGIHLYASSVLFRRILESPRCVEALSGYVETLHASVLSGTHVAERAEALAETVRPYLYALPDAAFARVTENNYDRLLAQFSAQIERNYRAYYDSLETPQPFHILTPTTADGTVTLAWESSSALSGTVHYTVELSGSWDFQEKLLDRHLITGTSCEAGALPAGQYFVRVTANAESGRSQEAYEHYSTEKKTTVHGVLCFYVLPDGTVAVPAPEL